MYRIMLADDEGIMLEALKNIITSNFGDECEIATAKTGRAVVELAESFRPDIAFMDIQMPGINGIQAIKEIQKYNQNTIFIVISAYDKFSYAKEAINLGVLEYLTNVRLTRAGRLLVESSLAIQEIAQKTGFASLVHFSRTYRNAYGVSPSDTRRRRKA